MGQYEILELLENNKDKSFLAKDIVNSLTVSSGSVCVSLNALRKSKQINYIQVPATQNGVISENRKQYQYKHKEMM